MSTLKSICAFYKSPKFYLDLPSNFCNVLGINKFYLVKFTQRNLYLKTGQSLVQGAVLSQTRKMVFLNCNDVLQRNRQNRFISINNCKEDTHLLHSHNSKIINSVSLSRYESTKPPEGKEEVLSLKDKLKRAVTEYGSTVIIFHVAISLVSLGGCYVLVSSGVDIGKILTPLGLSGTAVASTGTFVTAYAIHKVFAPVRISITLAVTPFIVRHLRKIGFLKKPSKVS